MSPPSVFSSTSKRSVFTVMGSPVAVVGAAEGTVGGGGAPGAASGVDGVGTEDGEAVAAVGAGIFGALCFCHASQRSRDVKEKTMRAMRRWVSIMIQAVSGDRV